MLRLSENPTLLALSCKIEAAAQAEARRRDFVARMREGKARKRRLAAEAARLADLASRIRPAADAVTRLPHSPQAVSAR